MDYQIAISALADPTRRAIVEALRGGALPVGELADGLPVSRPAVSQHLKVLTDAGLLIAMPQGNRRLYAISPAGIATIRAYLDDLWGDAFAAYVAAAHRQAKETP